MAPLPTGETMIKVFKKVKRFFNKPRRVRYPELEGKVFVEESKVEAILQEMGSSNPGDHVKTLGSQN